METAAEMTARHAANLGELAAMGMALARDLYERGLQAETPEAAEKLSAGFHRISRSVRQSMALEARLQRDAQRLAREAADLRTEAAAPTARRRAEVRARLARLVCTHSEDVHTAKYWDEGVTRLLAEAEFEAGFETRPVADLVETLSQAILTRQPPSTAREVELPHYEWNFIDPPGWTPPKSSPPGEVALKGPEGVEAHSANGPAPQPPQSAGADSSPGGEHLEEPPRYIQRGLPGEFAPWEAWLDTWTNTPCRAPPPDPG